MTAGPQVHLPEYFKDIKAFNIIIISTLPLNQFAFLWLKECDAL